MQLPLRAADTLDGLASVAQAGGLREARQLAAAAVALRKPRMAARWGYSAGDTVAPAARAPEGWIDGAELSAQAVPRIGALFNQPATAEPSVLDELTAAERLVAERVADGLTSRKIAEELFVSPRTVDAHLTHIYRKLDINSRSRLAVMVIEETQRAL
jgi:DNA-binding CsgD family transcriptional regulator